MGQQQLLFLVLCIVVIGIAVIAGIAAFSERRYMAEREAAVSDGMRIATTAQAWKATPTAMGGGSGSAQNDFTGVNLKAIGYPVQSGDTAEPLITGSGCFKLGPVAGGADVSVYLEVVDADCDPAAHIATIRITGPTTYDIIWVY